MSSFQIYNPNNIKVKNINLHGWVLVGGGRNLEPERHIVYYKGIKKYKTVSVKSKIYNTLDKLFNPNNLPMPDFQGKIVTGGARGVDSIADNWAVANWIPSQVVRAEWDKYGKRAGYLRTKKIFDEYNLQLVVLFPGGKGTKITERLAKQYDVPIIYCGETT